MTALESINHWSTLADAADNFSVYEESRGSSGAAYREKARLYRRTVDAIRLEQSTGRAHCVCCLKPMGPKGVHP